MVKTFAPNKETVSRKWYIIDLDGLVLGRASSAIATVLMGKHKPDFSPHVDNGDFVIAINAAKIEVTGRKRTDKIYYRHSGWPGGLRQRNFTDMLKRDPRRVIELAVKNMLPKNRMGRSLLRKLKVYADQGPSHGYKAQQPEPFPSHVLDRMIRSEK